MTLNVCTKFHENILDVIKVIDRTRFSFEINSKRRNSVKNVGGVTVVFFSAHRLMVVYICTKFYENILDGIKNIERTLFSKEIKGA